MTLIANIRSMDRRLRLMLVALAFLVVPGIGQFVAVRDLNFHGRESNLALLFMFAAIFLVPTSLILTVVTAVTVRQGWREHRRLLILGALNLLLAVSIILFFFDQCLWAHLFGLTLRVCR